MNLTAQKLFEILQKIPAEDRKHMKVVVSDIDDERANSVGYTLCISRVIIQVNRSFQS
jgi:hypothetical protein